MPNRFAINPPASASVEVFAWDSDVYGNPTANYLLMWSNGKTGAEYEGGRYRSKRREQVGYGDKTSAAALERLATLFPGTCWKVSEAGIDGSRSGDWASFQAVRDYESERVPVLFRAEKSGTYKGEITAVFPTLPGTNDSDTFTIYAHNGQHGSGSRGWYRTTRAATPEELEPLRRELESPGPGQYRLAICKRWSPDFDAIRKAELANMGSR